MSIIIPKRGYLTFAELRQRWQCTENDLRYLVVNGELKPSTKATEALAIADWEYNMMEDTCEPVGERFDGQTGYTIEVQPSYWLYLQSPEQTGAMTCNFRIATRSRDPDRSFLPWDEPPESWFWLGKVLSMQDVEQDWFFTMDEVLRYENAQDPDAEPPPPEPQNIPVARWPWGSHHTEMLGHLEAAALRFWVNVDPSDNTTAPTNKEVSDWLEKERKVSNAGAKAIASILRQDDLPTGPRK